MLTDYYKAMLGRLNKMDPGKQAIYETALQVLEHKQQNLNVASESMKPIKRNKGTQELSLFSVDGVFSVKVGKGPLGAGAYARTYLQVDGLDEVEGKPNCYAVKVFRFPVGTLVEPMPNQVSREIAALKRMGRYIRHGCRTNEKGEVKFYVFEEYLPGTTLRTALKTVTTDHLLSMDQALNLMIRLSESMLAFYQKNHAHGDVRSNNIMVDDIFAKQPHFTLIDFNDTTETEDQYVEFDHALIENQYSHIPLECCGKLHVYFTPKSDLYALGVVFQQILDKTEFSLKGVQEVDKLIEQMRSPDPKQRPEFDCLIKTLGLIRDELKISCKLQTHSPCSENLNSQTKANVLTALSDYNSGLRLLRGYMGSFTHYVTSDHWRKQYAIDDKNYSDKSKVISKLSEQIQTCQTPKEMYSYLKKTLLDYIRTYVSSDLTHYCELADLGAGMGCLIRAIKACDLDSDFQSLITEVGHAIPRFQEAAWSKNCRERQQFISKFSGEMRNILGSTIGVSWKVNL